MFKIQRQPISQCLERSMKLVNIESKTPPPQKINHGILNLHKHGEKKRPSSFVLNGADNSSPKFSLMTYTPLLCYIGKYPPLRKREFALKFKSGVIKFNFVCRALELSGKSA